MLLLLGLTAFGLALSWIYGWAAESIAARLLHWEKGQELPLPITTLLGVVMLSGLVGIWSLFARVGLWTLAAFSVAGLAALAGMRRNLPACIAATRAQLSRLDAAAWVAFGLIAAYGFYCAASAEPAYDTGLYHAQAIRWIETYRAVPGLANLHFRFGFDSSVFGLAALWGFAPFGWHSYQIPGLVIFVSAMLYFLLVLRRSTEGGGIRLSSILATAIPLFLLLRHDILNWLSSPATDLPADLMVWVAFCLAVEIIESSLPDAVDAYALAIVCLSFFAATIKFSTAPILLLPLLLFLKYRRTLHVQWLAVAALLVTLVFMPWVARKVVLTAYPLFPLAWPDVLRFDWKVPVSRLAEIVRLVRSFAILPYQGPDIVLSMKTSAWLAAWYSNQPASDLVLINAGPLGLVATGLYVVLHRGQASAIRKYAPVYAVSWIGLLFWFSQAPDPRLGYGFLVLTAVLSVYVPLVLLFAPRGPVASQSFAFVSRMLLLVAVVSGLLSAPLNSWWSGLTPYKQYPVAQTRPEDIHGKVIERPRKNNQCWYASFPCSPVIEPGVAMRGASLGDGFYIRSK